MKKIVIILLKKIFTQQVQCAFYPLWNFAQLVTNKQLLLLLQLRPLNTATSTQMKILTEITEIVQNVARILNAQ